MERITEVSYLYLYLILPRSAKISILSYLGDKRESIFLSYLRYFFKLSSPTLINASCHQFQVAKLLAEPDPKSLRLYPVVFATLIELIDYFGQLIYDRPVLPG